MSRDSTLASLKHSRESQSGKGEERADIAHNLKIIALREQMLAQAETYDVELTADYIQDARKAIGAAPPRVNDVELGQFYYQFKCLDVDGDGFFTVDDFAALVRRVDPDFRATSDILEDWLKKVTLDNKEHFNFIGYYHMVMARRDYEAHNWGMAEGVEVPTEFKQTPFWDLRVIVLHALSKDRNAWMLKRGDLFVKESLNSWKLRYVRTNTCDPAQPQVLEFWDADPNAPTTGPAPPVSNI